MSILVKNARYVITVDQSRRVIKDGAVAIDGNTIAAVGKTSEIEGQYPSAEHIIDASNCVVTPGLVNCHLHTAHYMARGIGDNIFLPTWIHERTYPYEAALKPEETRTAALACLTEALKTGTTFIADPGTHHMDAAQEPSSLGP